MNKVAVGWKDLVRRVQKRFGIKWDDGLGVMVYDSKSLKGGVRSWEGDGLKLSFETSF